MITNDRRPSAVARGGTPLPRLLLVLLLTPACLRSLRDKPAPPPASQPSRPPSVALQRLDRREYDNTVRDLLQDPKLTPAEDYDFTPEQPLETGYKASVTLSLPVAKQLRAAAEGLARGAELSRLVPCTPTGGGDEPCAVRFITSFGRRAFRRPLDAAERDGFLTLYRNARTTVGLGFDEALRLVLEAFLQAPDFLYKWEIAAPAAGGASVTIDRYQLASRLSYFLWGTMPDDGLIAATDAGALDTEAGLAAQVDRLLADRRRMRETLVDFSIGWLRLDRLASLEKDHRAYPKWNSDTRRAARAELAAFVEAVVFDDDARLATLLGARYTVAGPEMVRIYTPPPDKEQDKALRTRAKEPTRMELPAERRGLLTQVAFLAGQGSSVGSHPTKRGAALYRALLCGKVEPPPPNVPPLEPPEPGATTRERFEDHTLLGKACDGCHSVLDPWGFPFEAFKGIGDFRTTEEEKPIRTASEVTFPNGERLKVEDAAGLIDALKDRPDVRACYARQWVRYATGRLETARDPFAPITAAFRESDGNIKALLRSIASSPAFRQISAERSP